MKATMVTEGIYALSINVENILFEGLWEIPEGVALNSYIIKGEKTALVDGVAGWDGLPESMFELLKQINVDAKDVDYLIINHMEPDHSGWIEAFRKINPDATLVCSAKAAALVEAFIGHKDNIQCVKSGDTLDLGAGRVLAFEEIPNVHWPDTIATFDTLSGTLFPCDAFGSYGSIKTSQFDDELTEEEISFYEHQAVHYYANIVAAFSAPVNMALKKCAALPIKTIAPGHGIIWRGNPQRVMDNYARLASYQKGPAKEKITLIWGSMYGMSEKGAMKALEVLKEEGIKVGVYRVPEAHIGDILASVWEATGVVLAMPTYEYKMFPPMAEAVDEIGRKKMMNRKALRIGSYGWSGGAQKELDEIASRNRMNWDFLEPVEYCGSPTEEDLDMIEKQVRELVKQVKEAVNTK